MVDTPRSVPYAEQLRPFPRDFIARASGKAKIPQISSSCDEEIPTRTTYDESD